MPCLLHETAVHGILVAQARVMGGGTEVHGA